MEEAIKRVRKLERDLSTARRAGVREASADMLTELAKRTRDEGRRNIKAGFTLRSNSSKKYILNGVRSTYTRRTAPLHKQFTIAGAKNPRGRENVMAKQEEGGRLAPTKGNKRRLTTAQGSGEGDRAYPRKKLARGRQKPGRMKLARPIRTKGLSRIQRQIATVRRAKRRGQHFVWMRLAGNQKQGIFKITGSKSKPTIKMVHRVYTKTLSVPKKPWLKPAEAKVSKDIPATGARHLKRVFKRRKLFT